MTADLYAAELYAALRGRHTVAPLATRDSALTIDDAYAISLRLLHLRQADGERVIGKKIGVTSKPVQDMLGVHQPDFGFLTDRMWVQGDIDIAAHGLIQPRAEAEIGFLLRADLNGPGITAADVLDATEAIMPCFEIVDSRIENWKIGIIDTVADNASCGVFVLGEARADQLGDDRRLVHRREASRRLVSAKQGLDGLGRQDWPCDLEATDDRHRAPLDVVKVDQSGREHMNERAGLANFGIGVRLGHT